FFDLLFNQIRMIRIDAADFFTFMRAVRIECQNDFRIVVAMEIVFQKSASKASDTNQCDIRRFILVQSLSEKLEQFLNIIAIAFFAERTEMRKIPSNGSRVYFHCFTELL